MATEAQPGKRGHSHVTSVPTSAPAKKAKANAKAKPKAKE